MFKEGQAFICTLKEGRNHLKETMRNEEGLNTITGKDFVRLRGNEVFYQSHDAKRPANAGHVYGDAWSEFMERIPEKDKCFTETQIDIMEELSKIGIGETKHE